MKDQEDNKNQSFKVNDRRRFRPDGESSNTTAEMDVSSFEDQKVPDASCHEETGDTCSCHSHSHHGSAEEQGMDIPADFSSLVFSLAASAQAGLGLSPNPMTGQVEMNLSQAKYSIDMLGLVEEKTRGNLDPEEDRLLKAILFDLRTRFVSSGEKKG